MSWSLAGSGKAKDLIPYLQKQVQNVKLSDAGEQETVKLVGGMLEQALGTFDPERLVVVSASGSMGYANYSTKTSRYQSFNISVQPIHLSVTS